MFYRITWKIRLWVRMWEQIRNLHTEVFELKEQVRDLQSILMTKKKWK
jgi:hypothetical protein